MMFRGICVEMRRWGVKVGAPRNDNHCAQARTVCQVMNKDGMWWCLSFWCFSLYLSGKTRRLFYKEHLIHYVCWSKWWWVVVFFLLYRKSKMTTKIQVKERKRLFASKSWALNSKKAILPLGVNSITILLEPV